MNEASVHWVGIDVGKRTFDAALVQPGQRFPQTPLRAIPARTFGRDREGVKQLLAWVGANADGPALPLAPRVVMEATGGYSLEATAWLYEYSPCLGPAIVNPEQTAAFRNSLGLWNKTDRVEARALALYGAERRPAPYEPLTPERQELRNLSRYRDNLVREQTAESNRQELPSPTKQVRQLQERREQQRKRDIAKLEAAMKAVIEKTPDLKQDFDLLVTIPGVGFVTAAVMLAEMGDLRRFTRARQVTAFAGVSPREYRSGTSVNGRTRLSKKGNARVRQALYLAAMTTVRGDSFLSHTYQRLLEQGKPPMVALGAIMRKLLTVMRALLITQTPFNPCGKPRGKQPT